MTVPHAATTRRAADLYPARVMHRRHVAPRYRFVYRLFYLLVDLDRLPELHRGLRLFSHNRFNLLSFHDRDHGDGRGELRRWAEALLAARGVQLAGGCIRLLCLPRIAGFAFNPISLYWCEHADGSLRAVIAQVNNTFGERHCYVLDAGGAPLREGEPLAKDKRFHVSPFLDLSGHYEFRLAPPGARVRVHIREFRDGAAVLDASLAGERRDVTDGALLATVLRWPLAALKVVAAIHWEALKLWLRGARYHARPAPPAEAS